MRFCRLLTKACWRPSPSTAIPPWAKLLTPPSGALFIYYHPFYYTLFRTSPTSNWHSHCLKIIYPSFSYFSPLPWFHLSVIIVYSTSAGAGANPPSSSSQPSQGINGEKLRAKATQFFPNLQVVVGTSLIIKDKRGLYHLPCSITRNKKYSLTLFNPQLFCRCRGVILHDDGRYP